MFYEIRIKQCSAHRWAWTLLEVNERNPAYPGAFITGGFTETEEYALATARVARQNETESRK
jgi:hypothetical protein